ncbi:MAG: hypothetical protein J7484_03890 [Microbacterium sp.]|nr:hypothetical protein [Microbacterium sp.]
MSLVARDQLERGEVRRGGAARGAAAEFRRLRGDPLLWALLPLALLSGLSMLATLPPDLGEAPTTVVDAIGTALVASVVAGQLMIAAVLGALGVTVADRTGMLARTHLYTSAAVVFGARASSTMLVAFVFGAMSAAVVQTVFFATTGQALMGLGTAVLTAVASAASGLWGFLIGVLVRNPILALFVVPATLAPGMLLAERMPEVAESLPLGSMLVLADAGTAEPWTGAALTAGWVLLLCTATAGVLLRRDRL